MLKQIFRRQTPRGRLVRPESRSREQFAGREFSDDGEPALREVCETLLLLKPLFQAIAQIRFYFDNVLFPEI